MMSYMPDADLRYPIGEFDRGMPTTDQSRREALAALRDLPARMAAAVAGLDEPRLDTPYRPGGWTVRQVVHHVADSHMNGYVRMKLALTEERPTIKPYDQDRWATLPDMGLPIDVSLGLLRGIHTRWDAVCAALDADALVRSFYHPELGWLTVDTHLHLYAWHSRHHMAHITTLRQRQGW
jgi:hypothetical protein